MPGAEVRELMRLQVTPGTLNRSSWLIVSDKALRDSVSCGLRIAPANNRKMDGARSGDRRKLLPVEDVSQNWRLAPRSRGSCATGTFGQARFIDVYDDPPLPRRCFEVGHLFFFPVEITSSSRWRAWLAGRWTLQPVFRSIFRPARGVRRPLKRVSMSAAIPCSVQISFAYAGTIAPLLPLARNPNSARRSRAPCTLRCFISCSSSLPLIPAPLWSIRNRSTARNCKSVTHLAESP